MHLRATDGDYARHSTEYKDDEEMHSIHGSPGKRRGLEANACTRSLIGELDEWLIVGASFRKNIDVCST